MKKGGFLVYSTCTIITSENENQVAWILEKYPSLKLIEQPIYLGDRGVKVDKLSEENRLLVQRFNPISNQLGFFIAKFQKS